MNVCLMSVPHTGTTFTEELLRKNLGLFPVNVNMRGENVILRGHTYSDSQNRQAITLLRHNKDMPLICPLRHPYLAEESWKRRGYEINRMILAYRNLLELFIPRDPYIMAVDSERRGECLTRLSNGLGVELKTDWKPERSIGKTFDLKWYDLTPSDEVRQLAEDMADFLGEFYDKPKPKRRNEPKAEDHPSGTSGGRPKGSRGKAGKKEAGAETEGSE